MKDFFKKTDIVYKYILNGDYMQKKEVLDKKNTENSYNFVLNSGEIIDRVKKLLLIENDMKLARLFGMSQNTLYSWRARNNADIGLLIEKIHASFPKQLIGIDYTWLLTGKGYNEIVVAIQATEALIQNLTEENTSLKKELETSKGIISGLVNIMAENSSKA